MREDARDVWLQPAEEEVQLVMERLKVDSEEARRVLSKGLPPGWLACCTDAGEAYYHKPSTGVSQWQHPGRAWIPSDMSQLAASLMRPRRKGEAGADCESQETSAAHSVYDARSRHVELDTPDTLFTATPSIVREDVVGRAFALRNILTPAEAATYVASAQRSGFGHSDVSQEFPASLRNNSRLIHFSDALALALYRRLAPYLAHRDVYLVQPMGFGAEGRWKPVGINPCFRISQYKEGEHFATHCDGMYVNDNDECSIYSVVLYLNEDYEGGELEFTDSGKRFRPTAGTAVLLPHDLSHAGLEVSKGIKYVARSELMFRCVDRRPPPAIPKYADDPLFRRMAALYEQIGDLAAKGDASVTTKAYQEALGLQIAHQGTDAKRRATNPLPFEEKSLEHILGFLHPLEVANSSSVCFRWHNVTLAGALWQSFCRLRWPNDSEVLEGLAYDLEPELKDWMGIYRRQHILEGSAPVCVVFLASTISCWADGAEQETCVPATFSHDVDGVRWDCSFKQRVGWSCGGNHWDKKRFWHGNAQALNARRLEQPKRGYAFEGNSSCGGEYTMPDVGKVDFQTVAEAFSWAFRKLGIRATDYQLVAPLLPGLLKQTGRARLAQILTQRFEVPRLSFVDAPLCALRARGLKTGTVIWGEELSRSAVFFYLDDEEVLVSQDFHFNSAKVEDVLLLLAQARNLGPDRCAAVLADVVLSPQPYLQEESRRGPGINRTPPAWADPQTLKAALDLLHIATRLHEPLAADVLCGARSMAGGLPLVAPPAVSHMWQWRVHADGQWLVLPRYVAGVFEGALRAGHRYAAVQTRTRYWPGHIGPAHTLYLVADLDSDSCRVALCRSGFENVPFARYIGRSELGKDMPCQPIGDWCRLTRFVRGKPSETPDLRKPEDIERESRSQEEVVAVEGPAVHVRNLAGRLVFSMPTDKVLACGMLEFTEQLALSLGVEATRLKLLDGAEELDPHEDLVRRISSHEVSEFQVLICPKTATDPRENEPRESIPEDLPGCQTETGYDNFMNAIGPEN